MAIRAAATKAASTWGSSSLTSPRQNGRKAGRCPKGGGQLPTTVVRTIILTLVLGAGIHETWGRVCCYKAGVDNISHLRSIELVRLLAEPNRRRVVAALILNPTELDTLPAATGLPLRDVADAMARLTSAGLVEEAEDGTHFVLEAAFATAARADADAPQPSEHGDEPAEVARVLDQAFSEGRLVHLPTKRSKRLIVLDQLAQEFEPGQHYSERQVNVILVAFDTDVAALRRYLVDERFLDRAEGVYWRSGGTVASQTPTPSWSSDEAQD